jgi:hypothetical protein
MGEPLASPLAGFPVRATPRRRKGDRCNGGKQSVRPSALGRDFDGGVGSQKEVRMSNTHDEQIAGGISSVDRAWGTGARRKMAACTA